MQDFDMNRQNKIAIGRIGMRVFIVFCFMIFQFREFAHKAEAWS